MAPRFGTSMVSVEGLELIFSDKIRFPARPMVGVIGTAPEGEGVRKGLPGPHGGNMDNNEAEEGSKIHLPVSVPGALLLIGDVHVSMGDGEISYLGVEICAEVTVKVDLLKGETIKRPWIETPDAWVSTGEAYDLSEALQMACEVDGREVLKRACGVSFEDAYMLLSARGDLKISQCCDPGEFPVTTRVVLPKLSR